MAGCRSWSIARPGRDQDVAGSLLDHVSHDQRLRACSAPAELEEKEGAYPVGGNRLRSAAGDWVPLYEGKMVQAFDHRAAGIVAILKTQHRRASRSQRLWSRHQDPDWLPTRSYLVRSPDAAGFQQMSGSSALKKLLQRQTLGIIAALFPTVGFGNNVPILKLEADGMSARVSACART